MEKKLKNLFLGNYAFRHTVYSERCMAYSGKQAHVVICRRIAKKQGVEPWMVLAYFKEHPSAHKVLLEVEFEYSGE